MFKLFLVLVAVGGCLALMYSDDLNHKLPPVNRHAVTYRTSDGIDSTNDKYSRERAESRQQYDAGEINLAAYQKLLQTIETRKNAEIAVEKDPFSSGDAPQHSNQTVMGQPVPSNLPPTATGVRTEQTAEGTKIHWPVNGGWVKVATLQPGQSITADPNGLAKCHPDVQALGPAGTDALAPNPALRAKLALPDAPPYALIVRLGPNGAPGVLSGRYATSFVATGVVEVFVRINDFEPDIANGEYGYTDDEGDLPIVIK